MTVKEWKRFRAVLRDDTFLQELCNKYNVEKLKNVADVLKRLTNSGNKQLKYLEANGGSGNRKSRAYFIEGSARANFRHRGHDHNDVQNKEGSFYTRSPQGRTCLPACLVRRLLRMDILRLRHANLQWILPAH